MPKNIQTTTQLHSFHIQVIKIFSCIVHLCILVTSPWYLLLLLGPYHFYPLLCPSSHEICSLDISNFLEEICSLSHSYCFSVLFFFPIVHLRRLSYLSLLFSGTLHSVGYIFSFIPCLSLLFFLQVFVKPPQTTTLPSCFSFSWGWFWSLPPYSVTNLRP